MISEKMLRLGSVAAAILAVGAVSVLSFVQQAGPDASRGAAVIDPRPAGQIAIAAAPRPAATNAASTTPAGSEQPPVGVVAENATEIAAVAGVSAARPAAATAPQAAPSPSAPVTPRLVKNENPANRPLPDIALAPTRPMPAVQPIALDDGQSVTPKSGALTQQKTGAAAAEAKPRTARAGKAKRRYARPYLPYPLRRLISSLGH